MWFLLSSSSNCHHASPVEILKLNAKKLKHAIWLWLFDAPRCSFISIHQWISLGNGVVTDGLDIKRALELLWVPMHPTEGHLALAHEPSQPHLLVTTPAPIHRLWLLWFPIIPKIPEHKRRPWGWQWTRSNSGSKDPRLLIINLWFVSVVGLKDFSMATFADASCSSSMQPSSGPMVGSSSPLFAQNLSSSLLSKFASFNQKQKYPITKVVGLELRVQCLIYFFAFSKFQRVKHEGNWVNKTTKITCMGHMWHFPWGKMESSNGSIGYIAKLKKKIVWVHCKFFRFRSKIEKWVKYWGWSIIFP